MKVSYVCVNDELFGGVNNYNALLFVCVIIFISLRVLVQ